MKTLLIPDRLFPQIAEWARAQGLRITYRDGALIARNHCDSRKGAATGQKLRAVE